MRVVYGGVPCAVEGNIVAPGRENSVKRDALHCAYCTTEEVSHLLEFRVRPIPRSGLSYNFFCGIFLVGFTFLGLIFFHATIIK